MSTFLPCFSNVVLSPPKLGIEDFDGGRYEDGFLSCSFRRPTVVEVAKFGQTFNLERDKYIIFLAEGAFRGGQMFKHRRKTKSAELQVGEQDQTTPKYRVVLVFREFAFD